MCANLNPDWVPSIKSSENINKARLLDQIIDNLDIDIGKNEAWQFGIFKSAKIFGKILRSTNFEIIWSIL